MTIAQRYLARNLFSAWGLVFAISSAVFGLLFLISEMDRLGPSYHFGDAAIYVVLTLPQRMFELLPVIILLGSIMALIGLESRNELTILGVSGLGSTQLLKLMALPLLALMTLIWLAEEYVTPRLNGYGEEHKASTYGSINAYLDQATWSRIGNGYVHLGYITMEGEPRNIEIFSFADNGDLERALYAAKAQVLQDRLWQLQDIVVKRVVADKISTQKLATLEVDNLWLQRELDMLKFTSDSMPPSVLYRYSQFLEDSAQRYEHFQLSFWKRITLPLTCAAMLILATPLGGRPGSARNSSIGLHLGLAVLLGIGFYLVSQVLYALGEILHWHPALSTITPVVIILAAAILLLRRRRW